MKTRFLVLLALALALALFSKNHAHAGPWPFGVVNRVALGPDVVAVHRVRKVLVRKPTEIPGCRREYTGKKHWAWRKAGTPFYLYTTDGRRLSNKGYDWVAFTTEGLIYGVTNVKNSRPMAEFVNARGETTPILDLESGKYQYARIYYK